MKRIIFILITILFLPILAKTQGLYISSGATVYVNRNGSSTTTPILNISGTLQNNGILTDAGSISTSSDFTNGSTLTVNIGGTTLGTNYDQLAINGTATLTGSTLTVNFVNGYTATSGATFTILDGTALSGTFITSNLPTLSSGLTWNTSYNGSAGTVILSVTGVALSAELLDFKSTPTLSAVTLDWATAAEINMKDFILERSRDSKDFAPLSKTNAKGSNSSYQYLDEKPFNGVNYYRLKINDLDGKTTYSKIVSAIIGGKTFKIKVYPSLVSDMLTIRTDGGDISDFQIYTIAGQVVFAKAKDSVKSSEVSVNLNDLPVATYLVRAQNTEGVIVTTKIAKL